MKRPLILVLVLVCGVLIGYYWPKSAKTTSDSEPSPIAATPAESSNVPTYDGPFGLAMGLSLAEVKKVCKINHIENDAYEVSPPKVNDLFETYVVWIDPEHGLHGIRAISERIRSNDHGTELKSRFENVVESIGSKYGTYKRTDKNSDRLWSEPRYFMRTLQSGSRELSAVWAKKHQSQLPEDIAGISVEVVAENSYSDAGYVILEYGFANSGAVRSKADTVF